jgi:predicted esterase
MKAESMGTLMLSMIASSLFAYTPELVIKESDIPASAIHLFCHGLGATHRQVSMYTHSMDSADYPKSPHWIIPEPFATFDFADAINDRVEFHDDKVNLGQNLDMHTLIEAYEELERSGDQDIVLVGVSRGAVTILNTVALKKWDDRLKAIIVESPYDTLQNVAHHVLKQKYIGWIPGSNRLALKMLNTKFPMIDLNGIMPISCVKDIPKNLPIFLVHSRNDAVIPPQSSRALYIALVESGHTNVYYLEMAGGEHARLIVGPEGELYQNIIHAFYKRFGLPHNSHYAREAHTLLDYCKPNVQTVKKLLKQNRSLPLNLEEA